MCAVSRSTSSALSTCTPMVKRMPPLLGSGSVFPSREFGKREKGEHDAPQFEDREVAVVHHLRPTNPAVEVSKSPKVTGA